MTMTDRVEINPRVMLGKPVIRGTRIPVELLLRKLNEGASELELVDAYPRLTRDLGRHSLRGRYRSARRGDLRTRYPGRSAELTKIANRI